MMFGPDERAQSTLVGFILLFGILVIAFSSYQAVVVPNQNGEVEFNHFQDIQNDFTEFRSTLVNSVGSNEERAATFRLGTQYPARLLALNPPPVSGQLETIDDGNRKVVVNSTDGENIATDVCGTDTPTTNSLRYTPSYNEYGSPRAVSYENRFVAREFRDGNVYDEQRLIRESADGSPRIDLLLLNGSVSRASQESYSFDINASGQNETTGTRNVDTIIIPSQYSADEWNSTILGDRANSVSKSGGRVTIDLRDDEYRVSCAVAGLNGAPEFGPSGNENSPTRGGSNDFNLQDIRLNGVKSINKQPGQVELSFTNNNTNSTAIEEARINFYQAGSPGNNRDSPDNATISDEIDENAGELAVGGGFETVIPSIDFPANSESTVWLDFDERIENRDWFVITLQFEGVGTRQYFVSLRDEAGENNAKLPGVLTAEVTQEGRSNEEWIVTMSYEGSEAVDVTATPSNRASASDTIEQGGGSTTLNLGSAPSKQIHPITVEGISDSGQSCSATLDTGNGEINVC